MVLLLEHITVAIKPGHSQLDRYDLIWRFIYSLGFRYVLWLGLSRGMVDIY